MRPLPKARWFGGARLGAAFLMANSSIGPGFLTQTTVFTQQLLTSFGFVILVSVVLDVGAQLNTWRILTVSELRAQDLANGLVPGLGYFLAAMVILGGFAFNIGNIAGCGLGLNVLTGMSFEQGALISCGVALVLFWVREVGKMLDGFTKILGTVKILLTLIIAFSAHPPVLQALHHTLLPVQISAASIVTIVGGTVGGYITFSGAHRLLDAGIKGPRPAGGGHAQRHQRHRHLYHHAVCAISGHCGRAQQGRGAGPGQPGGQRVSVGGGRSGLPHFRRHFVERGHFLGGGRGLHVGVVFQDVSPRVSHATSGCVFRCSSCCLRPFLCWVGKPTQLLVFAGFINGLILPIALAIVLIAATRRASCAATATPAGCWPPAG